MALHIRDEEADRLLRDFAARRRLNLTDALKAAVREAADRPSLYERVAPIRERSRTAGAQPMSTDKAFFDALNDE